MSPRRTALGLATALAVASASLVTGALTSACSSTAKGDVSATCPDDGGCQPRTVFATGVLSAVLVTPDSVYAGDEGGNVYAADKPLRASRVLGKGSDASRGVASFVRTSRGLYWFTVPIATSEDPHPKSSLVWFPADGAAPVILAAALPRVRGMAAIEDVVYLAVPNHILRVPAGATTVENAFDFDAYALRSSGVSLYFHDGLGTLASWRAGDASPSVIASDADFSLLTGESDLMFREPAFAVDDSGIYWLDTGFGPNRLHHVPLAGGKVETPIDFGTTQYARALALDEGYVYWTSADRFFLPNKTTVHRAAKSALDHDELVGTLVGDTSALQATPEGLYIAASPSFSDLDLNTLGFTRYGGPLVIVPRAMLDALHP